MCLSMLGEVGSSSRHELVERASQNSRELIPLHAGRMPRSASRRKSSSANSGVDQWFRNSLDHGSATHFWVPSQLK